MFKQFYWNVYSGNFFGLLALVVVLTTVCSPLKAGNNVKVEDQFTPLAAKSICFNGYLEDYIQNSIIHWN